MLCVVQVVEINSLELDMHSLLSDQAEALLSRRRETVQLESSRLQQLCCECVCLLVCVYGCVLVCL